MRLDRAVRAIPHPTTHPKLGGALRGRRAEEHPLNTSPDDDPYSDDSVCHVLGYGVRWGRITISVGHAVDGNSATKSAVLAISEGWIIRSMSKPRPATISVFTNPGHSVVTLTPASRTSSKTDSE